MPIDRERQLQLISALASVVGALIAVVGFPLVIWQLSIARAQRISSLKINTTQVLLACDSILAAYIDVAENFSGPWAHPEADHPTEEEFPRVNPYLGVFERVFIAYQAGQVDAATLDELYGYRLWNIWNNQRVVESRLQNAEIKSFWSRFIGITIVLEVHRGKRYPLHTDNYFPEDLFDRKEGKELKEKHLALEDDTPDPYPWSWTRGARDEA